MSLDHLQLCHGSPETRFPRSVASLVRTIAAIESSQTLGFGGHGLHSPSVETVSEELPYSIPIPIFLSLSFCRFEEAAVFYHKALAVSPNSVICSDLLNHLMEDMTVYKSVEAEQEEQEEEEGEQE
jgi:hypothetical protein